MDNQNYISNSLQNILDEMINENLFASPRPSRQYSRRTTNENENMVILQLLREIVNSYDENMRQYSDNMRTILQIITLLIQRQYFSRSHLDPLYNYNREQTNNQNRNTTRNNDNNTNIRPNSRTRQTNYQSQILSYVIYPFLDFSGNILNQTQFQDVIIRPTQEQINNATRTIIYSGTAELLNHRCPISLIDFEEDQELLQIIPCGHCFYQEYIQGWFRSNVRCPVCRCDIRNYSTEETGNREQTTDLSTNMHNFQQNANTIFDNITNNLANILNNYLENEFDSSNNLINYNYEHPIVYRDLSYNRNFHQ